MLESKDLNRALDSVGSRQGSVAVFVKLSTVRVFTCYLEICIADCDCRVSSAKAIPFKRYGEWLLETKESQLRRPIYEEYAY
jgi:hypothetical protein